MHTEIDLVEVAIVGLLCLIVLIEGWLKSKQWDNYQQSFQYFRLGLLLLLIAVICNSLLENRWNLSYIGSFLSLKKTGRWWLFRLFASIGYILLAKGVEILLMVKVKKYRHIR